MKGKDISIVILVVCLIVLGFVSYDAIGQQKEWEKLDNIAKCNLLGHDLDIDIFEWDEAPKSHDFLITFECKRCKKKYEIFCKEKTIVERFGNYDHLRWLK